MTLTSQILFDRFVVQRWLGDHLGDKSDNFSKYTLHKVNNVLNFTNVMSP